MFSLAAACTGRAPFLAFVLMSLMVLHMTEGEEMEDAMAGVLTRVQASGDLPAQVRWDLSSLYCNVQFALSRGGHDDAKVYPRFAVVFFCSRGQRRNSNPSIWPPPCQKKNRNKIKLCPVNSQYVVQGVVHAYSVSFLCSTRMTCYKKPSDSYFPA